ALYVCERCITVDQEVRYIWHSRLSIISVLYMTLQVTTVAYFLLQVVQQFMTLHCNVLLRKYGLVITSLRVYAVSHGGRAISIVVFVLSLGIAAFDIVRVMHSRS
ncbi:hypothetical protein FOMPIDRAFT_1096241, partial [Fomitopsis schrenkii]